jgi:hypothetical protein
MSSFKRKNLKGAKLEKNHKKEDHYDIVAEHHSKIMKDIEEREKKLPIYKSKIKEIDIELDIISNPKKVKLYVKNLKTKIAKLKKKENANTNLNDVEEDNNIYTEMIKTQDTTNENILVELEEKLNIYNNIFLLKAYENDLKQQQRDLEALIYSIENNYEELNYYDDVYEVLNNYCKEEEKEEEIIIDITNLLQYKDRAEGMTEKKKETIDKYLQTVHEKKKFETPKRQEKCEDCGVNKLVNLQEGILVCEKCGNWETIIIDSSKPSFKDPITDAKPSTYKRPGHCTELLNQSQGKESTEIPQDLLNNIYYQLYVYNITDLSKVTTKDIKRCLKDLEQTGMNEHAVNIINKLVDRPPSTKSHQLMEKVKYMYIRAEKAWYKIKKKDRKNFINNNFVFRKIFVLLDEDEEAEKWPLLSVEKLYEHDETWEEVCLNENWQFIPFAPFYVSRFE